MAKATEDQSELTKMNKRIKASSTPKADVAKAEPKKEEGFFSKAGSAISDFAKSDTGKEAILGLGPALGMALAGYSPEYVKIGADAGLKGLDAYGKAKDKNKEDEKAKAKGLLDKEDREFNRNIKTQELGLKKRKLSIEEMKALKEAGPKTYQQRLSKLGAEERKRLDNIVMGKKALNSMADALNKGSNTFSMIGDNPFTFAASQWEEAIGRMQSGGAINDTEGVRFRKLIPGPKDSKEMQARKLQTMASEMQARLSSFGFSPDELPGFSDGSFQQNISSYAGGNSSINSLGMSEAVAGQQKPDLKKMSRQDKIKFLQQRGRLQGRGY